MMSNYPPGVTGNEDYFGPRLSRPDSRECGREEASLIVLDQEAARTLRTWASDSLTYSLPLETVKSYIARDLFDVEVATCPFSGEVDIEYFAHHAEWTCPLCGHTHEEEF